MSSEDQQAWIRQAQGGSVEAFEELYRAHVDHVYGLCLRMTADPASAEDCTQNTFIKAWRRIEQFRGRSGFGTWLHRIAVNEVLMVRRRETPGPYPAAEDSVLAQTEAPDTGLDLEAAIEALPQQARHIFVLRALYGHTHEEIAGLMELASGTVRAHYHRARQGLKQQLGLEKEDD